MPGHTHHALVSYVVKGGVPFFWGFSASLLYSCLAVTIPTVVQEPMKPYLQFAICLIFVESVTNWLLISRIERPNKSDYCTVNSYGEWRNCDKCQAVVPPRSHHCQICNVCILRRDHHCYFTGSCIGHNNQRNFIVLLTYLIAGSILGVFLDMKYVNLTMPLPSDLLYYLPVLSLYRYFFIGDLTVDVLLIMIQGYLCVFTLVSAAGYLFLEVKLTVKGQTQHESDKNDTTYSQNMLKNIKTVFGSLWLLPVNFIIPISIPLPNNWDVHKSQ